MSPKEQQVIVEYLPDVMADATLRGHRERQDEFLADLVSDGYPAEAVVVTEATLVRASSRLNHHDGVWVAVVGNSDLPRSIELVNDVRIDAWTMRVTVYAQSRIARRTLAPAQVGQVLMGPGRRRIQQPAARRDRRFARRPVR